MMLQIGVGYAPRAPRALQAQPAQRLLVAVASDNMSVTVNPVALTVEVAAPSRIGPHLEFPAAHPRRKDLPMRDMRAERRLGFLGRVGWLPVRHTRAFPS